MKNRKKIAVVLFNLGGPDSSSAIRPFLMNFFMDKNIIRVPNPLRSLIAWNIARRRSRREAAQSYGELGGKSPLLENSQVQAEALEVILNSGLRRDDGAIFKIFVCMRYWHPMADQVVRNVQKWGAEQVMLIPLYPQFSTTTTWSSLGAWNKAAFEAGYKVPTSLVCCYPCNKGFIKASAANIAIEYQKALDAGHESPRILFSAHGLPESVIKSGDPYQWQCNQSAEQIAATVKETLALKDIDWAICYQSRIGPKKWIGPSVQEELERAVTDKKAVVLYPHSFTQEHVETLVELDIEYKKFARGKGLSGYYRAQTVGTHPDFIRGLADLVIDHLHRNGGQGEGGQKICPINFKDCCMIKIKDLAGERAAA